MTAAKHFLTAKCGAKFLALAALLCATLLQIQEVSHFHQSDESYSHCLVCENSSGVALRVGVQIPGVRPASFTPLKPSVSSTLQGTFYALLPRGPPHYS